jgi:tripartite-type tricarboxylate transporter receptor subunit TctC
MHFPRRTILHWAAGALALTLPEGARAQVYPSRLLRLIVAAPAGGPMDVLARLVGQLLSDRLGQPVIIENRPGAGTNIGTEAAVKAPPDGHTLLLVNAASAINATLYPRLSFNFIRDIAPVAAITREPLVMQVNPSVPARTIPEFVAYAKAAPAKINMASGGSGAPSHIAGELFKMMAGVNLMHVPYRGAAPALTDLIGGQVQVYFGPLPASVDYIKTGRLRALAVTTTTRSAVLPDIPTMAEFVPGYEASTWYGVGVPRHTPAAIIDRLNREINSALNDPKFKAQLADLGGAAFPGTPAGFGQFIAEETEKWGKVITFAGIKPE